MMTEETGTGQKESYDVVFKFYLELIESLTKKIGEAGEGGTFLESLSEILETIAQEMVDRWQTFRCDHDPRTIDLVSLQYRRAIGLVPSPSQKRRRTERIETALCASRPDLKTAAEDPKHPYKGQSPYSSWNLPVPLRLRMYSGDRKSSDVDDLPNVATLTMSIARLEKSWMWLAVQLGLVDERVIYEHLPRRGRSMHLKEAIETAFDEIGEHQKWAIIQEFFDLMRDQARRDRHKPTVDDEVQCLLNDSKSQMIGAFQGFETAPVIDSKGLALLTALTSTRRTYRIYRYETNGQPQDWERNLLFTTIHIQQDIVGGSVLYSRRIPRSADLLVSNAVTRLAIYRLRAVEEDVSRKLFYQERVRNEATKFHQHQIAHDLRKLATGIAWAIEDLPKRTDVPADARATLDRVRGEVLRLVDMTQSSIDSDATALGKHAWETAHEDRLDEFVKDSLWLPEMVVRRRRPAISFQFDLDAARVRIPRTFVSEVLENLVSNAVDHAIAEQLVIKVTAKVLPGGSCWFRSCRQRQR